MCSLLRILTLSVSENTKCGSKCVPMECVIGTRLPSNTYTLTSSGIDLVMCSRRCLTSPSLSSNIKQDGETPKVATTANSVLPCSSLSDVILSDCSAGFFSGFDDFFDGACDSNSFNFMGLLFNYTG